MKRSDMIKIIESTIYKTVLAAESAEAHGEPTSRFNISLLAHLTLEAVETADVFTEWEEE